MRDIYDQNFLNFVWKVDKLFYGKTNIKLNAKDKK